MVPVRSTNLSAIGYDPTTATLSVRFLSGALYNYFGVPRAVYEGLLASQPTPWRVWGQTVKQYPYERVG